MSKSVVFPATYSDFRLVKGRKVAVVHLEIPIERATEFVAAFGIPNPGSEQWVAIAKLSGKPEGVTAEPVKAIEGPRRRWSDLTPAEQAGIRCSEAPFRRFLAEEGLLLSEGQEDPEAAAKTVRAYCGVSSRAEIKSGTEALRRWNALCADYDFWMRQPA